AFDRPRDILLGFHVNARIGLKAQTELFLLGSKVNSEYPVTHCAGILDPQSSNSSTSPNDHHPLPWRRTTNLQSLIRRHTTAHDGRQDFICSPIRKGDDVPARDDRVAGECAIHLP